MDKLKQRSSRHAALICQLFWRYIYKGIVWKFVDRYPLSGGLVY